MIHLIKKLIKWFSKEKKKVGRLPKEQRTIDTEDAGEAADRVLKKRFNNRKMDG